MKTEKPVFSLDQERDFSKCPKCEGSGAIFNPHGIGQKARDFRKANGVLLYLLAAKMRLSKGYLSDLELGRRAWRKELLHEYLFAVESLVPPPEKQSR